MKHQDVQHEQKCQMETAKYLTETGIFNFFGCTFRWKYSFQSIIDFFASVILFLLGITVKDPSYIHNHGVLAQLECMLWNTEFLQWGLFFTSAWNIVSMTVERFACKYYIAKIRINRFVYYITIAGKSNLQKGKLCGSLSLFADGVSM